MPSVPAKHEADMIRYFTVALLASLLTVSCAAGVEPLKSSDPLVAAIGKLVEEYGVTAEQPGVAVLVYQPGKMLVQYGWGLANLDSRAPITTQTMFELASVSKI